MYETRIKHLKESHRLLDDKIDKAESTGVFEDNELTRLKKERLKYKKEIAKLEKLQQEQIDNKTESTYNTNMTTSTKKPKSTKAKATLKNVPSGGWPVINQGTHLTVKTFEDGHTELVWDDDALLAEVRAAILKAESVLPVDMKPAVKAKAVTQLKKTKKAKA